MIAEDELRQVRAFVQKKLPDRPCKWSERVRPENFAPTLGAKDFSCDIVIDIGVLNSELRWAIYLHEMLHAFSEGCDNETVYGDFRRWEEGVVEKLERMWRGEFFLDLGISLMQGTLDEITYNDLTNPYNAYITPLETIRQILKQSEEDFYTWLLALDIKTRERNVWIAVQQVAKQHNYSQSKHYENLMEIVQAVEELREEREEE